MTNRTTIGWTDATWNPVTGCSKISKGCANCYAAELAPRLAKMGAKGYTELAWTAANSEANVFLHPGRLLQPLKISGSSKTFFTCSMSDLFHERVPDDHLDKVFAVMALAGWHTFQVLTKRAERMRDYLSDPTRRGRVDQEAFEISRDELGADSDARNWSTIQWPLENLWVGTSVEDQRAANERIPYLLDTPAAIRFLSCEPLLDGVDLCAVRCLDGAMTQPGVDFDSGQPMGTFNALMHPGGVDWVIAGGESGPNYRRMEPMWARWLCNQCRTTGTPFFFKQNSGRWPESDIRLDGQVIRQFPGEDP